MTDLDLSGKRVLIREDFNVPLKAGKVESDARIVAALPTIREALSQNAKVILVSHLGRPTEGEFDPAFSLAPVAQELTRLLGQPVPLLKEWLDGVEVESGQAVLCENVRFQVGEKKNSESLSQKIAALCDIYVNDAFATAHREEASTCGVAQYAKTACAGPLMTHELEVLSPLRDNPETPVVAIVGGSKVSTKIKLLHSLVSLSECLLFGGGLANTFLAASGFSIGKSLYEEAGIADIKKVLAIAKEKKCMIPLPSDVVVAKECSETAVAHIKRVEDVEPDDHIFDLGPQTIQRYMECIRRAKTIIWNGPVGVFELSPFEAGTKTIAHAIAESEAYSVVGGGDTLLAIEKYHIEDNISYRSTGGGAFLSFLEGNTLPAVAALELAYQRGFHHA